MVHNIMLFFVELNQIAVDSPDKYGLSPLMIAGIEG